MAPPGGASWELRRGRFGPLRPLLASCLLALVGGFIGGIVGTVAAVFFGSGTLILLYQTARSAPVAVFDAEGITFGVGPSAGGSLQWTEVPAILLWTAGTAAAERRDLLGALTPMELDLLSDDAEPSVESGRPGHIPRHFAPLSGCILDSTDLRSVLNNLGSGVLVVDRRRPL